MASYIFRRVLLMIPTILGIMLISFLVVQFAPGGPVERVIAQLQGTDVSATARIGGGGGGDFGGSGNVAPGGDAGLNSKYRGAQGLDPQFIADLEKQFGFDKPAHERFLLMIWNYARFDFGESYFRDVSVLSLIAEKLPVSISSALDDADLLCDLHPARDPQGGAGRKHVRRVDVRSHRDRLCSPGLSVRHLPDRVLRWRHLLSTGFPCAASPPTTGTRCRGRSGSSDYFWHLALPSPGHVARLPSPLRRC
jgi:hypothetical protein